MALMGPFLYKLPFYEEARGLITHVKTAKGFTIQFPLPMPQTTVFIYPLYTCHLNPGLKEADWRLGFPPHDIQLLTNSTLQSMCLFSDWMDQSTQAKRPMTLSHGLLPHHAYL